MPSEAEARHDHQPELVAEGYIRDGAVRGFVLEPRDPGRIFVVELVVDGWPCRIAHAAFFEPLEGDRGEGFCHGFVLAVPNVPDACSAEVRLANTSRVIVSGLDLSRSRNAEANPRRSGMVEWLGGLRISGWLTQRSRIRGLLDGRVIVEVAADRYRLVIGDRGEEARHGFEAFLPPELADGCVHLLDVVDAEGLPLHGSPLSLMAFADGAAATVDHAHGTPRAWLGRELLDALLPQSCPLAFVERWSARFPPPTSRSESKSVALVMIGEEGVDLSLASMKDCACPWVLAVLPSAPSSSRFEADDLVVFLETEAADCSTVVVCASGTRFEPNALSLLDEALEDAASDAAFGDVICSDAIGRLEPLALPSAFDMLRALHQGAGVHLFALRRTLALRAVHADARDPFALLTYAFDAQPRHVAGFLATCPPLPLPWARDALRAATLAYCRRHFVDGTATIVEDARRPAVKLLRAYAAERLTVCVEVGGDADAFAETLDHLRSYRGRHGLELFLVDIATTDKTRDILSRARGETETVVAVDGARTRARAFNLAIEKARSRYVMLLPAGCRFDKDSLFEDLLIPCQERDVAGAGPCLVSAEGFVRAAGYVLGPRFSAAPAFANASLDDPGYDDLLKVGRCCAALPLEGMVVKRSELVAVGGLDDGRFGRHFYAIDLALKLRARGRRLACVPDLHLVVPDRLEVALPPFIERGGVAASELTTLRNVWGQALLDDPFYSGLLAVDGVPYTALAWPPRGPRRSGAGDAVSGDG